jgi:hypothetical protein
MFEYLMPMLVMPSYENTLLDQTARAAVQRQIEYGRQRNVPWGISESGYNATDTALNYQYRAFGVPGLGLKRGLAEIWWLRHGHGADDRAPAVLNLRRPPRRAWPAPSGTTRPSTTRRRGCRATRPGRSCARTWRTTRA